MVIYKITNNINGKIYIGQTLQPVKKRWAQHKRPYTRKNVSVIASAISKYGEENFTFELLSSHSSLEELNRAEEQAIAQHNSIVPNGYNLDSGGKNKKMHADTKAKLSLQKLGKPNPSAIGRPGWNKGLKGVQTYPTGVLHHNFGKTRTGRPVYCTTNDTVYCHAKMAGKLLGLDPSCIGKICKGKRTQDSGYTFIYVESI